MPDPYTRITRKVVDDVRIASIRFLGQMEEVDGQLDHLTVYSTAQEAIDWIRGAIEQLDAIVPDE